MSNLLPLRVSAQNKANDISNRLYDELAEYFNPLVGCKILKNDGSLLKKHADEVSAILTFYENRIYKNSSNYNLSWDVSVSESSDGRAVYQSAMCYIGEIEDSILKCVSEKRVNRTDYTVDDILKAREEYKQAKEAAYQAERRLYPFGEYDR